MIRSIAAFTAIACLAACGAPRSAVAHKSELFAQSWNSGLSKEEPAFQVQAIDKNTYAIRQSIHSTFEAPFLYRSSDARKRSSSTPASRALRSGQRSTA